MQLTLTTFCQKSKIIQSVAASIGLGGFFHRRLRKDDAKKFLLDQLATLFWGRLRRSLERLFGPPTTHNYVNTPMKIV